MSYNNYSGEREAHNFNRRSWAEAKVRAKEQTGWIVPGLISSTTTLLFGQSKVGKSFLTSALMAAMVTKTQFLGEDIENRDWKIAIGISDDDADVDHIDRVHTVVPEDVEIEADFFEMPRMRSIELWHDLFREVTEGGFNFLILDNATGLTRGSLSDDNSTNDFFEGVRLFTRAGIPVLIIAHETDKTGVNGPSGLPVGSFAWTANSKSRIQIYRTNGKVFLKTKSNNAPETRYKLHHGAGARFTLLEKKSMEEIRAEREAKAQEREQQKEEKAKQQEEKTQAQETEETAIASFIVAECQGMTQADVAKAVVGKFGGTESARVTALSKKRGFGKRVLKDGTTWTLAS
ncbi:AAA family ATPase [Streptomyces sp. NPDC001634]|uniref:AAA family ATPase n=1 Tax=Streptomyces sp. NPDC001634 TaxID=3154390 RepID=UPI00332773A1